MPVVLWGGAGRWIFRGVGFGRYPGAVEEIFLRVHLHLPEAVPSVFYFGEIIEGSGGGEETTLLSIGLHAAEEVGKTGELGMGAGVHEASGGGGGEVFEALEAEAEGLVVEDEGFSGRMENGDWSGPDAMPAGVTEESGHRVESQRLIVDETGKELGRMVGLKPAGCVGNEGKGDGMTFGEAVEGKGTDGLDHLFLDCDVNIALGHAEDQLPGDVLHALVRALEGHGAAQFVSLSAIKTRDDHGHAKDLFLEERNTEGAFQNGLEVRMDAVDRFATVAAVEIGVHEIAHDWAGTDESHLDNEIVEVLRSHDGQGGHLGAGLDLEGAHRVGAAEEVEGGRVVMGNAGEVDALAALVTDAEAVFHGGEHAQAKEVDFHDAEVFTIVLVPLRDGAVGHGGRLQRNNGIESVIADDHSTRVLTEVTGEGEDLMVKVEE